MQGEAARPQDAAAFVDGLLRTSFDMLEHLIGQDEVEGTVGEAQRKQGVLRVVGLDKLGWLQPQEAAQLRRVADAQDPAGPMWQGGPDRFQPAIHEVPSNVRSASKANHRSSPQ